MGAYDRVLFHGKPTDRRTADNARRVEARLGVTFVCWQGSYSTGVEASAGTHDGGGALDLNVPGGLPPEKIVRHLRNAGFAAWYRTYAQGFDPHIHALDIGNDRLAPLAQSQVTSYLHGGTGLASGGDDPQPFRPTWETFYPYTGRMGFDWVAWRKARRIRDQLKDLTRRIRDLTRRRKQARRALERLS